LAQVAHYHALGLRERLLTLPVMVAFLLSLIWRHLGSVSEAVRVLQEEGLLWTGPLPVSQQAVSFRLQRLPADLFAAILHEVLPQVGARVRARTRPVPPAVAQAQRHFSQVLALDGSTLDALLRTTGLLRGAAKAPLAGRMAALLEIGTPVPQQVWYEPDSAANDQRFWERMLAAAPARALLLFDLGFLNYAHFDDLTTRGISYITRAARKSVIEVIRPLSPPGAALRDEVVWLGVPNVSRMTQPVRRVAWAHQGTTYTYLTNVLDPQVLAADEVVALYWQRWRIEDAFNLVKRLLGLAYFAVGSTNGVQVQLWSTWLLYAVLVDLTDAVAEALQQPMRALSVEMVYRGLYHFTQAFHAGRATDPVAYLASKARPLGVLKRARRSRASPSHLLDLTVAREP
jgi:hypothetical protein